LSGPAIVGEAAGYKFKTVAGFNMASVIKKWKWGLSVGLLITGILFWSPLSDLVFSVRLLLSLQKLASGATGEDLAVEETKINGQTDSKAYEALLYRSSKLRATEAVIVVPGLSELGCYHPRLVAFSRFLADRGLIVITPDIREFRNFQITAEPIEQILFWYKQAKALEEGRIKKIGLAGISYSGTLALMTAARPEIRDSVAFVVAIGPYYDLLRCTRGWFHTEPADSRGEYYPTKFYARWIIMLSALDLIPEIKDRLFLHDELELLLLQQKVRPPGFELTPEGLRWHALATQRTGQSDQELAHKIEQYLVERVYPQLDPKQVLDGVHCPVFLIHGAYDDLIPPTESMELNRRVSHSYLLVSPFLTHTHPNVIPLSPIQKAGAVLDTLDFCYQFSRVIR
jgi:pimeloyl-ACP methyl ester carboxylesterase